MQKNITYISSANLNHLKNLNDECYILDSTLEESFCRDFIISAQKKDIIVLFHGKQAIENVKKHGADGIICELEDKSLKLQMENLRKTLGKNSIIGLISRNRRHEAMLISELEPDFIIFKIWKDGIEKTKELLEWYADFFLIQSAGWIIDEDINISDLKADFIIK